jgi:hypothetical protein
LYIFYPRPAKIIDDFLNDEENRGWVELGKNVWVRN